MVDLLNKPRNRGQFSTDIWLKSDFENLVECMMSFGMIVQWVHELFYFRVRVFFFCCVFLSHTVEPCQNNPCNIQGLKTKKGRDKRERKRKSRQESIIRRNFKINLQSKFSFFLFGNVHGYTNHSRFLLRFYDSSTKGIVTLGSKSFRNRAISDPLIAHQTYNFPAPTWPASICGNTLYVATIEHSIEKLRKGG